MCKYHQCVSQPTLYLSLYHNSDGLVFIEDNSQFNEFFVLAPVEELTLCHLHPVVFVYFCVKIAFGVNVIILDNIRISMPINAIQFWYFSYQKPHSFIHQPTTWNDKG